MISGAIGKIFTVPHETTTPADSAANAEEAALLRRGRTGDREALGLLLTPHEAKLLRLCTSILGNLDEAEDAVQEAFLRALRALTKPGGFRGDCAFPTWLYRIAIRVCLDRRREKAPLEIWEAAVLESVADTHAPIPEIAIVNRMALAQALAALQPRQRTLIVLREQEGWSAREIGEAMGWNEKRVHNELFKTRQQLLRLRRDETKGGIG